jgi:hypothetical protein
VLGAESPFVAGERLFCQFEPFTSPPAGDQRESQLTTLAVRLWMVVAKAVRRAPEQILAGQNRLRSFVLTA